MSCHHIGEVLHRQARARVGTEANVKDNLAALSSHHEGTYRAILHGKQCITSDARVRKRDPECLRLPNRF